ncbi:imidazole glycerol phosphate synthase cyclase subunit [Candidatus Pelagibacter sp.]|jgi:imidazole glycerol-phosphate synthase subunit HisF|nr:imidazole glycerol phosphate synthase cyclase subunit [Candidatus Pelagibacter sp.]
MRNVRVIARLDIKNKYLIKGIHLEGLRKLGKPYDFASQYFKSGIDEIIYMDSVASLYNRNSLNEIIEETSKNIFIPITVGGGIRSIDDAYRILRSGADKIAINTSAVENPQLIEDLSNRFGSSTVVLSIEAKKKDEGKWESYTNNGREKTGLDVIEWSIEAEKMGVGEILITSVDKEGTCKGFDYDLIEAVSKKTFVPIIASGGMGELEHFKKVVKLSNCDGVAIGNMLHYSKTTISDIKLYSAEHKLNIRV